MGGGKKNLKNKNKQANDLLDLSHSNYGFTVEVDKYVLSTLVLTVAFFFLFAPFSAIQNLESSLNAEDKLGPTALATLYLVYTFGMIPTLKKIMLMILWMSIVAGIVITIDSLFGFLKVPCNLL